MDSKQKSASSRVNVTVFFVSFVDRIHAYLFLLLWIAQLELIMALSRKFFLQWVGYTQILFVYYPVMILDGIYLACKQTKYPQMCTEGAEKRRLAGTIIACIGELAVFVLMIIFSAEKSTANGVAALRSERISHFAALIITQAILMLLPFIHAICQRLHTVWPGRMAHASMTNH